MKVTDEDIKSYLTRGGLLINVTNVDSYRDGGTKVIECNYATPIKFYIDKDKWTIHNDYPTSEKNLVSDEFLKKYLIYGIKNYKDKEYNNVLRIEEYINKLEENN